MSYGRGHCTGYKRERHHRRATTHQYAERAALLAKALRDKTIDELLAVPAWQPAPQQRPPGNQTRGCRWCGAQFVPDAKRPFGREQDYCSLACATAETVSNQS